MAAIRNSNAVFQDCPYLLVVARRNRLIVLDSADCNKHIKAAVLVALLVVDRLEDIGYGGLSEE